MGMKNLALVAVTVAIVIFTILFATTAIAQIDDSGVAGTEYEGLYNQTTTLGSLSLNIMTFIPILICIGGLVAALAYFGWKGKGKGRHHH